MSHNWLNKYVQSIGRSIKYTSAFFQTYNMENYAIHMRALKQALNYGLILKKVHRVIQFNQKTWLKEYIQINN